MSGLAIAIVMTAHGLLMAGMGHSSDEYMRRFNAELNGKKGIAPNTHFKLDAAGSGPPPAPAPPAPAAAAAAPAAAAAAAQKTATAIADYTGSDADELTFKKGQKIVVYNEAEPGW